ncbi:MULTISPECIES: CMP deaminase [unclassified Pseudofrankia]|uniref:CMP deaminase n=1 Tax=unclassified Pseudofrankia TaxID=2994372 RepID=UPI0008DA957B|nr:MULTISPECIES: CMP deaminase [unclassified Pseudofrankia]MDT3438119.1 nucleoside deaminase [Pseudofrankia sp. BMG5.37]OHV56825.1 CMP deaminase [Pseudofrankia sp. BMG5.36]
MNPSPASPAIRAATALDVVLPAWVDEEARAAGGVLPDVEDRMRLVHRLAARNHQEGSGGPFAAAVANPDTGEIYAAGVNLVLATGVSAMHAEVVALSFAQTRLGLWDLSAAGTPVELVVNWRPCVMCYGAVLWSGVQLLTIAGDGEELEQLTGFDEGPMRDDWAEQFARRGITVRTDILRDEALKVFADYGSREDVIVYNARRGAAAD